MQQIEAHYPKNAEKIDSLCMYDHAHSLDRNMPGHNFGSSCMIKGQPSVQVNTIEQERKAKFSV